VEVVRNHVKPISGGTATPDVDIGRPGKIRYTRAAREGRNLGQETFLPAIIAASNAAQHLASVALEWEDDDKLMRWRSVVEVTTLAPEGAFNPYGSSNSFATSYVVGINNNPPRPV